MSTDAVDRALSTYPRPHTSAEHARWTERIGETLTLRLASHTLTARLRRVTLDCTGLMPAIRLHVETPSGSLVVSPSEVASP